MYFLRMAVPHFNAPWELICPLVKIPFCPQMVAQCSFCLHVDILCTGYLDGNWINWPKKGKNMRKPLSSKIFLMLEILR